ncbi:MAG: methylmalonyl-CoA epimerase [Acidobacteria bacterium]|nr:methylmalonyl-CoA epimerase [Acidobacteriota bacterium]
MRIHHVGIAVESLDKAVPVFELLLGSPPASQETVEDQKVRVAVFEVGESRIELLEPSSPDSPVARFIGKRGPGIHHLTLAVEGLQATLDALEQRGIRPIDRHPRPGAGEESVAFLHPSTTAGILIELLEAHDSAEPQPRQRTGRK